MEFRGGIDLAMETILSVSGLQKEIRGKRIIQDVTFDVYAGEIFGFLGPNGSGKTTTIRMLVNLVKPTAGTIKVCGYDVNRRPDQALKYVGCIVENPEMYGFMSGWENLEHFARMQPGISEHRIREVAELVGLDHRIHDKVKTYSLGMRQRLGIAQALLAHPKLLILDEPTNGLDPKGIKELRLFMRHLADAGMSLFVSSHLLSEIELMCDRVAIISQGKVLAVGKVEDLLSQAGRFVVWNLTPAEQGLSLLRSMEGIRIAESESESLPWDDEMRPDPDSIVTAMDPSDIPEAVRKLVQSGIRVNSVTSMRPSLEQLFLRMTEGERIG
jgi:ABC-2 type transport system ATP-binding protein